MLKKHALEKYLQRLLTGNRLACRAVIEETLQSGVPANNVYMDVIWPIMVEIDKLYSQNRIDAAQQAFATRINHTIVDQLQNKLPRKPQTSKKIVVCCSANQQAELGGQMITDLFESDGWETRFLGGDVNNDSGTISPGSNLTSASGVPEPASLVLVMIGMVSLMCIPRGRP